ENIGFNGTASLGFPELSSDPINLGYPNVSIGGFDGIGEPINTPQKRHDNTYQFSDTLAWTPQGFGGRHRVRAGFDMRKVQLNFFLSYRAWCAYQFAGAFTGNPLEDLVRGIPVAATRLDGNTDAALRTTAYNFFVADDIQLHPQLTLNLGVRYEINRPIVDTRDRMSVPDTSAASLTCTPQPDCQFIQVGTNGIPRAGYESDSNN